MEICRLEHIHKDYRMGETVTPLKDINITVNSGDFVAVEGPSGMGKSTLLYVIGTLLKADDGKIFFDGKDVMSMTDREQTSLRGEKVGFLFQDSSLIQALTLRENLEFAQTLGGKRKADPAKVDEMLERVGLAERANFLPYQLSGGQRRRAMVARALIHTPDLILADEPTNDLDDVWAEKVVSMLQEESRRGAAVIMVTHNTRWSAQASVRYRLDDGVLLQQEEACGE
ncbi:MAG: ABC transporter ATP-binding protein [Oscillospiraceae bacterium]|nr:ABC transporter ATP-binding protein [Oscillospiraceae bacterium]